MKTPVCILLLVVMALGSAAAAQDVELTETYTFANGHTFSYPDDWEIVNELDTMVALASDLTQAVLVDSTHFEDAGVAATGMNKSLSWYFSTVYGSSLSFDAREVKSIDIGERSGLSYAYEDTSENNALMIALPFSDDTFGVVTAASLDGALAEEAVVLAIAESFDSGGEVAQISGEAIISAGAGVACTVSTSEERTVNVHVGPGENRTSYTFLPVNVDFEVLGQATADDDSLWWKLDKEAVAPDAAAAEAWIAQDEVEASGDCELVLDVNAPPIIPIVSEPPPEPTASGSEDGEQPPTTTEGGTTPAAGSWTISFASTAPASCLGSETIHIPMNLSPETYSLTISSNAIVYGGDRLTLRQPGVYGGLFTFGTISAEIILRVRSSALMTGEIIFTEVYNDTACSITVPVTVTRN